MPRSRYFKQDKAYRQAHLPHYAALQRQWRGAHPRETLLINARVRAKRDKLPCTISLETIDWVTHCPVLGVELIYGQSQGAIRHNQATLDRKDNSKGYVPGNVFVISHRANRLKQDATAAEVEAILHYMKD